jgi:hypothetical protein
MTYIHLCWLTLLVAAAGVIVWSMCRVSAQADRQAERMSRDWRERKKGER